MFLEFPALLLELLQHFVGTPVGEDAPQGVLAGFLWGHDGLDINGVAVVAQGKGDDIAARGDVTATGVSGVVLLEVALGNLHALWVETGGQQLLGCQQGGMKPYARGTRVPRATIIEGRLVVLDGAAVEDIAPRGFGGSGSHDDVRAAAVKGALLGDDAATLEPYIAGTTDEVDGAMNLGIEKVVLALLVVGIVGVLIGQHPHAVADGSHALVLQADGASVGLDVVVVEVVAQRQVLEVVVLAPVLEDGGLADAFYLSGRCIADDGALGALPHQRHLMTRDARQRRLAEVVVAVGNEYEEAFGVG